MIIYGESPAPRGLEEYIECEWELHAPHGHPSHVVTPDGCVDILREGSSLRLIGTMTRAERFPLQPGGRTGGIRFRPGMISAFASLPVSELTDSDMPLDAFKLRAPKPLTAVQRAIRHAEQSTANLDWLIHQTGLSSRQFRRQCLEVTGVSPKLLLRILRFRRAWLASHKTSRPNWADLAAAAGFYDQAHLIRDFREFAGLTPMSVFSNTPVSPRE